MPPLRAAQAARLHEQAPGRPADRPGSSAATAMTPAAMIISECINCGLAYEPESDVCGGIWYITVWSRREVEALSDGADASASAPAAELNERYGAYRGAEYPGTSTPYMTIRGSVMLAEIWSQLRQRLTQLTLLCGRTEAPLTYSSSLMLTSSPRTVMFSTRH